MPMDYDLMIDNCNLLRKEISYGSSLSFWFQPLHHFEDTTDEEDLDQEIKTAQQGLDEHQRYYQRYRSALDSFHRIDVQP